MPRCARKSIKTSSPHSHPRIFEPGIGKWACSCLGESFHGACRFAFVSFDVEHCRAWKQRRVVCTDSVLAIAHVQEQKLLDTIPLVEIHSIQDMGGLATADLDENAGRILLEITVTDRHIDSFFARNFSSQSNSKFEEKIKCRKIFDTIDTDKTGTCSMEELTVFLRKMFFKPDEIAEFIKLADSDRNGESWRA